MAFRPTGGRCLRPCLAVSHGGARTASGFTLIEILIVIFILGILAAIVVAGIGSVTRRANESTIRVKISDLNSALQRYLADEDVFPAFKLKPDPDRNDFPVLFNALFGEKRPKGPGGRGAPYTELEREKIRVLDPDGTYRPADEDEYWDPKVDKYYFDPWDQPLIYRCNKGKTREPWMRNPRGVDIYSTGPNMKDDTIAEIRDDKDDDIGNW